MKLKSTLLLCASILALTGCGNTPEEGNKLVSISIATSPTKSSYSVGDKLDPTGLVINAVGTKETYTVAYEGNEEKFSFAPSLNEELDIDDTSVVVTYEEKTTIWTIEISDTSSSFTADFTVKHEKVDDIPSTGNTNNAANFVKTLNKYYLTEEDVQISTLTGAYAQITGDSKGFQVTKNRNIPQTLIFGGQKQIADLTITFSNTIKSVSFVCEAYSKYVAYSSTYNTDYDTSLTVNNVKKEITAHQASDVNETQTLKYVVNSTSIHIEVPNTNTGDEEDKKGNRILVYQMIFEY